MALILISLDSIKMEHMKTTNAGRLRAYKVKMHEAGFKRLSVYVHPDLVFFLKIEQKPNECGGRALERLLLGKSRERPSSR